MKTLTPFKKEKFTPEKRDQEQPKRPPLVKAGVIANQLNVHTRTVHLWAVNKTIPSVRIGKVVRFDLQEVMAAVGIEA